MNAEMTTLLPETGSVDLTGDTVTRMRDADLRSAIAARVQVRFAEEPHILVSEVEVRGHDRRMDLLLVGSRLTAFEIKSDVDTLVRLQAQSAAYSRVVDRAVLVVGARYAQRACELIPDWWAVWQADWSHGSGGVRLRETRRGRANLSVESAALVELLLAKELRQELRRCGVRGVDAVPAPELRLLLQQQLDPRSLQTMVRRRMLWREQWRARALSIAPQRTGSEIKSFPVQGPAAA